METAKVDAVGTDAVTPDEVVVDSEMKSSVTEPTSHPLPDMFGAQVCPPAVCIFNITDNILAGGLSVRIPWLQSCI